MKVALIQCPSWTRDSPNYSIALLGAELKQAGHVVMAFDLNYFLCKKFLGTELEQTWYMDHRGTVWYKKDFVDKFFSDYKSTINSYLNDVLKFNADILCFTIYSTSFHSTLKFVELIRQKNKKAKVIFGGPECFPQSQGVSILKNPLVDALCQGEADYALPKFLENLQQFKKVTFTPGFAFKQEGVLIDGGIPEPIKDLNCLPFADFSIFKEASLIQNMLGIATSRGCFNLCNFCWEAPQFKRYRFRSARNIVEEIKHQLSIFPQVNSFWFNDSLINGNIKELETLCDLLLKENVKIQWGGQASLRKEMTLRLLKKMKKAGLEKISYGLESGSCDLLKMMNKNLDLGTAKEVIINTKKARIFSVYNIIVGYPGETEKHIQETKEFIKETEEFTGEIYFSLCQLFMGTYLFRNRDMLGIIIPEECYNSCWYFKDGSNDLEIRKKRLEDYHRFMKSFAPHKYVSVVKEAPKLDSTTDGKEISIRRANIHCYTYDEESSIQAKFNKDGILVKYSFSESADWVMVALEFDPENWSEYSTFHLNLLTDGFNGSIQFVVKEKDGDWWYSNLDGALSNVQGVFNIPFSEFYLPIYAPRGDRNRTFKEVIGVNIVILNPGSSRKDRNMVIEKISLQ